MKILVVICTYNRAELLRRTLSRLCEADQPLHATWSLLIVNNKCTDHTQRVIDDFRDRLPLQSVHHASQGLGSARNRAVDSDLAADADYIVWTDDDVLVERGWLRAYEAAFRRFPDSCLFGGNVIPWFEEEPPAWLLEGWETFKDAFAVREFDGSFPLQLEGLRIPFGANYAIRTREQRRLRYDPNLGPIGTRWLGGDEVGVMWQLLQQGQTGWWVPDATVRHFIPRERISMAFLAKYFRGQGATQAIQQREDGVPWFRKPAWLWKRAAQEWTRYALERRRGDVLRWSRHFRAANFYSGKLFA